MTSAPIDPWTVERARRPGAKLIRVIDLERDSQRFDVINKTEILRAGLDYELDGCTLIFPARKGGRTEAEIAHLVALYDELYREQLTEKA